jgi:DNA end-binding protein Ku
MAPRSFWKGYLKLSLVTCPVTMEPARTAGETLRFHTVNRETANRVASCYVDAETGKRVAEDDQAKGYEIERDRFVILEDEELEAVSLESTRTIAIERFVPREDVGWIWLDRPHFLRPADKVGEEAFAVIREAMVATETAAVSRLVLYRREHAVTLVPRGRGIVLWTLRYGDEVRPADNYFPKAAKAEAKMTRLVTALIDSRTEAWSERFVEDTVQKKMKTIVAGKKPRPSKATEPDRPEPSEGNVVSILDALKRSVASDKDKGKTER